jgi:NTE family protein
MSTPAPETIEATLALRAERHTRGPKLGLVLGSGAARGWAHIGVIRTLEQAGIRPDLICGTSVGAVVAAAYAAGVFDRFESWVRGMRWSDVISFMDVRLSGGLLKGARLMAFFKRLLEDRPIEELEIPFAAVATTLRTGAEVWLRSGSTLDAVRASIAMPGLFKPVVNEDVVLVDGALVNPVPVSLGRAMGADIVVAVDLSSDVLSRHLVVDASLDDSERAAPKTPSLIDVIASSLEIMQVRITRSRMAGEPPDVVIAPRLAHLGLLDFHCADEAIKEGERAASAALENLKLLGVGGS